jgi:hypothetical protein
MATESPVDIGVLRRRITTTTDRVTSVEAVKAPLQELTDTRVQLTNALTLLEAMNQRLTNVEAELVAQDPGTIAPQLLVTPNILGTLEVGETLTVETITAAQVSGTVADLTFAYQWQWYDETEVDEEDRTKNLSGETAITYVTDEALLVRVLVTPSSDGGTGNAVPSAWVEVAVAGAAPVWTVGVSITGTAEEGETLTFGLGTVTGTPTPDKEVSSYRVALSGVETLINATAPATYVLQAADRNHRIKLVGRASNGVGPFDVISESPLTDVVQAAAAPAVTYRYYGQEHLPFVMPATVNGFAVPAGYGLPVEFGGWASLTPPAAGTLFDDGDVADYDIEEAAAEYTSNPRTQGVIRNGDVPNVAFFGGPDKNPGRRKAVSVASTVVVTDLVPPVTTPPPASRVAWLDPGHSDCWVNVAIGSSATYTSAQHRQPPDVWAEMPYSDHMALINSLGSPLQPIYHSFWGNRTAIDTSKGTNGLWKQGRIPTSYITPPGANGQQPTNGNVGAFIMINETTGMQCQPLSHISTGGIFTQSAPYGDDTINGFFTVRGARGGSGLSAMVSCLRTHELFDKRVPHVLGLVVGMRRAHRPSTAADGRTWPAVTVDSYWNNATTGYGREFVGPTAYKMGCRMAIHPSVNLTSRAAALASLGIETEPGYWFAVTMQDYGGVVGDDAYGERLGLCVEHGPGQVYDTAFFARWGMQFNCRQNVGGASAAWMRDVRRVYIALQIVTNTSQANPGGGGTPRVPRRADL